MSTDDIDIDRVTDRVVESLDPGTVIDDKIILNRRQVVALASGAVGVGALGGWASGEATAQTGPAGQQGTADEPNDMFAWDLNVANEVTSDLAMGGNNLTNVGSLSASDLAVENQSKIEKDDDQTIPDDTPTVVEFESVAADQLDVVDINDNSFTVSDSGTYLIGLNLAYRSTNADTVISNRIRVNGSRESQINGQFSADNFDFPEVSINPLINVIELNADDSVDFRTWQRSGADETVAGTAASSFAILSKLG